MPNQISQSAIISKLADIEESVRGNKIVVGEDCRIDSFVKIKFAGGLGDVLIGSKCYINSGCVLYSGNGIQMGNNVLIAANTTFAPVNHNIRKEKPVSEQGFMKSKGGIIVGNDVWIGANCVILDGAYIPDGCVIGAASVVSGKLEPYCVYAGNPLELKKHRI